MDRTATHGLLALLTVGAPSGSATSRQIELAAHELAFALHDPEAESQANP